MLLHHIDALSDEGCKRYLFDVYEGGIILLQGYRFFGIYCSLLPFKLAVSVIAWQLYEIA